MLYLYALSIYPMKNIEDVTDTLRVVSNSQLCNVNCKRCEKNDLKNTTYKTSYEIEVITNNNVYKLHI